VVGKLMLRVRSKLVGLALCMSVFSIQATTVSVDTYLKQVYPLLPGNINSQKLINSFDFYYAPFPTGLDISTENKQFYCLAWMYACGNKPYGAIFRNLYHPKQAQQFRYINGYPSNSNVEVMHSDWYNEPSLYFYVAKGTGIYFNIGKTLRAKNKIDALKKMGLSDIEILSYAPIDMYTAVKKYAAEHKLTFKKALSDVIKSIINNKNYQWNRYAGGTTYDVILTRLCRKHHYATFQFTMQPNDNKLWGYELMDCRTPMSMPLLQRWQHIKKYFSQRNPLNLKQKAPCHFQLPFNKYLACQK
jgi:hypothetical protein